MNSGTEHVVTFTQSVACVDGASVGRYVRGHPSLAPQSANASFAEVVDSQTLRIRTYERRGSRDAVLREWRRGSSLGGQAGRRRL